MATINSFVTEVKKKLRDIQENNLCEPAKKRNASVSDHACQALGCSLHLLSVSVLTSLEPVEVGAVMTVHFTHEETDALRVRCSPGLYNQKREDGAE